MKKQKIENLTKGKQNLEQTTRNSCEQIKDLNYYGKRNKFQPGGGGVRL